jgi:hypothetical protein
MVILTAVVTVGLSYLIGLCITSHFEVLDQDEWN